VYAKALAALVALSVGLASAQVQGPAELNVPVGRLAALPLTVEGGEHEYVILGDALDGLREYDPDPKKLKLRVIGYTPGVAYVVVSSTKGGKLQPIFVCKVTVGGVEPGPQPGPKPPPDPKPPDPPAPTGVVKYVVVVEETGQAAANRGAFFADAKLHSRLKERGVLWRAVDRDAKDASGQTPADIRRFIDDAKAKSLPQVYLLDKDGRTLYSGNLTEDPARLLLLLEKYGG
jgi:hypothetical protein